MHIYKGNISGTAKMMKSPYEHEQYASWAWGTMAYLATFIIPEWIFETEWLHNN